MTNEVWKETMVEQKVTYTLEYNLYSAFLEKG